MGTAQLCNGKYTPWPIRTIHTKVAINRWHDADDAHSSIKI